MPSRHHASSRHRPKVLSREGSYTYSSAGRHRSSKPRSSRYRNEAPEDYYDDYEEEGYVPEEGELNGRGGKVPDVESLWARLKGLKNGGGEGAGRGSQKDRDTRERGYHDDGYGYDDDHDAHRRDKKDSRHHRHDRDNHHRGASYDRHRDKYRDPAAKSYYTKETHPHKSRRHHHRSSAYDDGDDDGYDTEYDDYDDPNNDAYAYEETHDSYRKDAREIPVRTLLIDVVGDILGQFTRAKEGKDKNKHKSGQGHGSTRPGHGYRGGRNGHRGVGDGYDSEGSVVSRVRTLTESEEEENGNVGGGREPEGNRERKRDRERDGQRSRGISPGESLPQPPPDMPRDREGASSRQSHVKDRDQERSRKYDNVSSLPPPRGYDNLIDTESEDDDDYMRSRGGTGTGGGGVSLNQGASAAPYQPQPPPFNPNSNVFPHGYPPVPVPAPIPSQGYTEYPPPPPPQPSAPPYPYPSDPIQPNGPSDPLPADPAQPHLHSYTNYPPPPPPPIPPADDTPETNTDRERKWDWERGRENSHIRQQNPHPPLIPTSLDGNHHHHHHHQQAPPPNAYPYPNYNAYPHPQDGYYGGNSDHTHVNRKRDTKPAKNKNAEGAMFPNLTGPENNVFAMRHSNNSATELEEDRRSTYPHDRSHRTTNLAKGTAVAGLAGSQYAKRQGSKKKKEKEKSKSSKGSSRKEGQEVEHSHKSGHGTRDRYYDYTDDSDVYDYKRRHDSGRHSRRHSEINKDDSDGYETDPGTFSGSDDGYYYDKKNNKYPSSRQHRDRDRGKSAHSRHHHRDPPRSPSRPSKKSSHTRALERRYPDVPKSIVDRASDRPLSEQILPLLEAAIEMIQSINDTMVAVSGGKKGGMLGPKKRKGYREGKGRKRRESGIGPIRVLGMVRMLMKLKKQMDAGGGR